MALFSFSCVKPLVVGAAPKDLPSEVPGLLSYADKALGDPPDFERALAAATRIGELDPKHVPGALRGARAAFEIADASKDGTTALRYAEAGVRFGERSVAASETCGECHYYLALSLGIVARNKTTAGALDLVKSVAAHAKRALALVPGEQEGGPARLLGLLYARVPPWPTSFGDIEEAIRVLRANVAKFPGFPLNRLFLGEALMLDKRYDEAKKELARVLAAPPAGEWSRVGPRWRKEAKKLLRRISVRERDEE